MKMTIEEAIEHAEEAAERHECTECGKEHAQLAEWLKELKERRKEKHGHWMRDSEGETVCSECGKHTMDMQDEWVESDVFGKGWALKTPNYCSRCGAKMDEVSDGEK